MATKPVISIDVDDSKFEAFFKLFSEYNAALGDQPKAWNALNDAMAGAGESLEKGAASSERSLSKAAGEAQRVVINLRQAGQITTSHTRAFNDFGKAGAGAWKAIGGAADASMAKTSSGLMDLVKAVAPLEAVTAVLGPLAVGVAAIGGIIAAKKALADVATPRQRSAFGLGTTTGKASSFEIYANQFLGQDALASAAGNQLSLGSQGQLAVLGIDFNKATKMSPGDLAFEKLKAATTVFKNAAPGTQLQQPGVQAYLALGGHIEDLRNAAAYTPNALAQAQKNVAANAGRLGLNKNAVDSGTALSQSINAGGGTLQALAINKLSVGDQAIAKGINFVTGGPSAARDNLVKGFQSVTTATVKGTVPALHALQKAAEGVTRSFTTPIAGSADAATIIGVAQKKGIDPGLALALAMQEGGGVIQAHGKGDYGWFDKGGEFHFGKGPGAHYTSFGAYQLHESGELGNLTMKQAFDVKTNANVALSEIVAVQHMTKAALASRERMLGVGSWGTDISKLSPGQIGALAQRPADAAGYAKSMDAYYRQVRNTRPPAITVKVSNPTQSRVAVSINAAALTSQF